ncbi:Hsp90 binding co-chaperone (Sba1) [Penicillium atrosanguineum]|uniref:Hsp90 binding co-chaperone (Sba1) n=1 Tax=Penicillium atrosanguineum TaxID=1132637 RepID=A0A9W9Q046_9EURO|nr:uncharacterized protein N7443_006520 [Penicillium atrosanguineum]KAJ5123174.1 Hsp90 binding co-chaperone (Sba1) [Penicillium atrosanguineum]KAJ5298400.1 hypothetical protein N7443_006520 [Penicillium atrosanguineum]KAJ5321331.1 Hsp90 binding co-chaperone (Sba1) [Penicillium atrosanguineum]
MSQTYTPEVTWAQRSSADEPERNYLYVNIKVSDVPQADSDLKITPTEVSFTGKSVKGVTYSVSLPLYAEIDPENSKVNHTDRYCELVLRKKELKAEFWPRLLKEAKKLHFLKTDFDKWVDEDEQDEAGEDDYANNFGGFDGQEQGGAGGGLSNIDFSKLGGMGGAGGMPDMSALAGAMGGAGGMPDLSALAGAAGGAQGEGEDDEDLPELEETDAKSSKIQEVS